MNVQFHHFGPHFGSFPPFFVDPSFLLVFLKLLALKDFEQHCSISLSLLEAPYLLLNFCCTFIAKAAISSSNIT